MNRKEQDERARLNEEFDRILLHDAIADYLEQSDEYEQALRDALSGPTYELSKEHRAKMDQLVSSLGKKKPDRRPRRWVGRLAVAASLMVVAAGGMLVVSDASIEDILEFFTRREQTHTEVILSRDLAPIYRQLLEEKGWEHTYYPAYLPSQYVLDKVDATEDDCVLHFSKGDAYIRISQYSTKEDGNTLLQMDTEGAAISPVDINGLPGEYVEKGSSRKIYFSNGGLYFVVTSNDISRNQLVKVAKNIKSLKSEK